MENPNLETLIEAFLTSRSSAKPSPHTTAAYRRDLVGVARRLPAARRRFLAEMTTADISKSELRGAFASWAGDHAKTSVLRAWSTWNSFYAFLVSEDLAEGNPMDGIRKPRRPKAAVKVIRGTDVTGRLLAAARTPDPGARRSWPERDVAIVAVLAVTGLRLGEVVSLRIGSLDGLPGSRRLTVVGKGDKARSVPIYPAMDVLLDHYLATRVERFPKQRASLERPMTPLFVDLDGEPVTPRKIQYLIERLYRRAGVRAQVPPGALVHALRHTFATAALEGGASVVEVSQLLGHESLDTTKRYLEATAAELREAVVAHPAQVAMESFVRNPESGIGNA